MMIYTRADVDEIPSDGVHSISQSSVVHVLFVAFVSELSSVYLRRDYDVALT